MTQKKDWRTERRKTGGSIKTINGYLYARVQYLDDTSGKRKEKLRPAKNRTHARSLIDEMRKELNESGQDALEKDKVSFNDVADRYKKIRLHAPIFRDGIKVSGLRSYESQRYILKPIKSYFGRKAIRNIKPADLEAFKAERLNTPVIVKRKVKRANTKKERRKFIFETIEDNRPRAIASVNRELSLLRQIFVFALSEDFITRNPFARTKNLISQAAENKRDRVLSKSEEDALLRACEIESRKHIRPVIITALDTAMRKGELLKLKWNDVDLIGGRITVQATNTKTETQRLIGITERVKGELQTLWDISPKDKDILVFGIEDNFKRSWKSALKVTGLINTDLHFHDLRHTAITRMIRAGISASEVMDVSGHTEMKTFQRYVNSTNESVTVAANLLDKFNQSQSEIHNEMDKEMVN